MKLWQSFLILSSTVISSQAFAHVEYISTPLTSSFMSGLLHPFSGADHIVTLLLAGVLIARFAAGQIKMAISTLTLLSTSYLWLHGAEMSMMNSNFAIGFLASSLAISGLAFLMDKIFILKLKKRHA